MARNKIEDLNNHLFAQLERLDDPELDLDKEIQKAKAVSAVASQIINANRLTIDAMKLVASGNVGLKDMPESLGLKKLTT